MLQNRRQFVRAWRQRLLLAAATLAMLPTGAAWADLACSQTEQDQIWDAKASGEREIRDLNVIEYLKFVTFNTLNLGYHSGKYVKNKETGEKEFQSERFEKDPKEVEELALAMKDLDADVFFLQEVESVDAMRALNTQKLGDRYDSVFFKGNDGRIGLGFMVKKDLPLRFELRENKDFQWSYAKQDTGERIDGNIFSRDLPVMIVRGPHSDQPIMALVGTHFKSQRGGKGDFESIGRRTGQVEAAQEAMRQLQAEFEGIPVFMAGDFNADVNIKAEFNPLRENGWRNTMDIVEPPVSEAERVSQTYFPPEGERIVSQLDAFMVNEAAAGSVRSSRVYRFKEVENGELTEHVRPLPENSEQRDSNPSDHYPIEIVVDMGHFR